MSKLIVVSVLIVAVFGTQLVSGDWFDKIFRGIPDKMTSSYEQINAWLAENVADSDLRSNLNAAKEHFDAEGKNMKPKLAQAWSQFLDLTKINDGNCFSKDIVKTLKVNAYDSFINPRQGPDHFRFRIHKVLGQAFYKYAEMCRPVRRAYAANEITRRQDWATIKELTRSFGSVKENEEVTYDIETEMYYFNKLDDPKLAMDRLIELFNKLPQYQDAVKVGVNEVNGRNTVDRSKLDSAIDEILKLSKKFADDLEPFMAALVFDLKFGDESDKLESGYVVTAWKGFTVCQNLSKIDPSKLKKHMYRKLVYDL